MAATSAGNISALTPIITPNSRGHKGNPFGFIGH
jgi:hypothetical protein